MTRLKGTLKSFAHGTRLPRICVLAVTVGDATACWAQEQDTKDPARARRSAELDEKVDELFEQFNVLKSKLKEASDQAATNLGAELDEVGRELAKAYNEREAAFRATAAQWSESIDAAWEELRDHESIDALQNEIERLKQWAEAASEEGRAKLLAMADSLAEQMNVLQEDLQKRYREAAGKANAYLTQTKT